MVPTRDEKNLAVIAHLAPLAGYFVAIGQIAIPLILYLTAQQPFVRDQAREALNAQISFTVYFLVAGVLAYLLIGLLILPLLALMVLWTMISACLAVSRGNNYHYPLIFRLFG